MLTGLSCVIASGATAQPAEHRPFTNTLSNLREEQPPSRADAVFDVKQAVVNDLKANGALSADRLKSFANLPLNKLIERLAIAPPVGPSTIAAPKNGRSVPAPAVNWVGDKGGATTGHPGVALLLAKQPGRDLFTVQCSGTLIRQNIVLTAAHCMCYSDRPASNYATGDLCQKGDQIRTPAPLLDETRWRVFFQHGGLREVKHIEIDGDYKFGDAAVSGDIAVLVLANPVKQINPPTLPATSGAAPAWATGTVVGFGYSAKPNAPAARILQQLVLPGMKAQGQVSSASCSTETYLNQAASLCALYDPNPDGSAATICGGDSGGPLWTMPSDDTQIGVTSGRNDRDCTVSGTLGFQMSVGFRDYRSVIDKWIKDYAVPTAVGVWPVFGENLRNVVDRRNVQVFDDAGRFESDGWMKLDSDKLVLGTMNSSGQITLFAIQDRTGKTLCTGVAGAARNIPNVDLCWTRIASGVQFRVVAQGTAHESVQFVVTTHSDGSVFFQ